MQVARIDDIHIHYATAGRADGPTLVLVNSLGTDFRIWAEVATLLPATLRVILYDKRGHGLSDAPPAPYTMDDHVADLAGLLARLNVTRATVGGLSVGGMIAQRLAATRPDLVDGLLLCDTGHRIGTAALWNGRIDTIREGGIAAIADGVLERWFSADFRAHRGEELQAWRNMLVRTPVEGYAGTAAAIRDCDLTEGTRALRLPTLCIGGSEDKATPPELMRDLAALIPGADFALVEGAGHLPCVERPQAVAGLIIRFLETTGHV